MTHSKNKGKVGELEVVQILRAYGFEARRGQQFSGTSDSPDVVHSMEGFHIEVKRSERFNLYDALAQAENDASEEEIPIIIHRRSRQPWVVVIHCEDFLQLMKDWVYGER